MPRAGTPETRSPPASSVRPRIGFSIDFLVGNSKRKSPASSSPDEPEALVVKSAKTDASDASPPQSATPDSSRSASPHNEEQRRVNDPPGTPGSPLFQSWNPASVMSAGHPPGYIDMAALANLRQLYEQQHQQQTRPGFFPHPGHPAAGFPLPPGPPPPGAPTGAPLVPGAPPGLIRPGDPSNLAAQQWWLLAQARQHQQRLFAAAAVANRFPPGK